MNLAHGGNVYEIARRLGCSPDAILDYSASINPLGPPAGLLEELNTYFHRLQHYPDIGNRALTDSLAAFHGVSEDRIVVGNGSTELIYRLPGALNIRKAVVALPTFSEYGRAFEIQGVEIRKLFTGVGAQFQPTVEQLEAACREFSPDAVLLTHPGSPSGALLSRAVREWVIDKGREGRLIPIVDEVFIDFCEDESLKGCLDEPSRIVLIRSMTKFYGLPGLRIGYVLTTDEIAARIRDSLPPWSVNTFAQIAGPYCLKQPEYRERTLRLVTGEREKLIRGIEELDGINALPGRANYLLAKLRDGLPPAGALREELLTKDRILIRDCSSFEGLSDRFFRVAVRLPDQNRRLLDGLTRWAKSRRSYS